MTANVASKKLVIFGTGTIGELAHYFFTQDSPCEVVAFTADSSYIDAPTFEGLPLLPFDTIEKTYPPDEYSMFVGLSSAKLNQVRQAKYEAAKAKGYTLVSYVASHLVCWENVEIGDNCFILENQTIQPFVKIGNNVVLWSGNHIGHHSTIGDHTFITSHVVICGYSQIGNRCFIGVNAALRDFCIVGDDSFIGMTAKVSSNVPAGGVVVGPSGETLAANDRRAAAMKRRYFGV